MRSFFLLPLLSLAPSAAAAQAIVVPVVCQDGCSRNPLALDSVEVWANLQREEAVTYVRHTIRNESAESVEGAFFFPVPAGAELTEVSVYLQNQLELYGGWTEPKEAQRLLRQMVRGQRRSPLRAYAGTPVVHMRVPAIPAHGRKYVRIAYRQPLRARGETLAYRYPLSRGASAAPVGTLTLGMTVKTPAGFVDLRSPTHAVNVEWGTEAGPCPPQARCGTMSVPSRRVKIVRLQAGPNERSRDFELVYTPSDGPYVPPARIDADP